MYDGIPYQVKQGQAIGASLQKMPISMKIRLMKALVWPVATYNCETWTLRKDEETRFDAFERKILRVSWTAKKTNEWVLNKAGVNRELLDTVEARKLPYYGRTMRKQLILGWVTVSGFDSRRRHFISVCNQPPRSTQPSTLRGTVK